MILEYLLSNIQQKHWWSSYYNKYYSMVNISSSHFESNSAQLGGAIFSEVGSNVTITNCTFVNNSASGCNDDRCHGGALLVDSGCIVTAHKSTFVNNRAGSSGGAIALYTEQHSMIVKICSLGIMQHLEEQCL